MSFQYPNRISQGRIGHLDRVIEERPDLSKCISRFFSEKYAQKGLGLGVCQTHAVCLLSIYYSGSTEGTYIYLN